MNWLPAARIFFACLFVTVTFLTLTPNPEDTEGGMALTRWLAAFFLGREDMADKIAHFLAYGALGFSAMLAHLRLFGRSVVTALALAAYGAALEGVQGLGGVRSPELADAIANGLGALCAYPPGVMAVHFLKGRVRA